MVTGATYVGSIPGSTGAINFGTNGGTLTTESLLAGTSQLTGTGMINTRGLVSDIDLLFDATHGLIQTVTLNSLPGQNISVNLDMTGTPNIYTWLGAGWNGTGSLTIQDGIAVNSNACCLGCHSGSTGLATVNGPGSKWTNIIDFVVGLSGSGTLNITNGGSVSSSVCHLGFNSDSTGTVTVDGSGSTWTNWDLYVGYYGSGTLNILNGSTVSTTGVIYVGYNAGSTGTINFGTSGGTLYTQSLFAAPSQLTGAGMINAQGLVSDVDLVFDATHDLTQTILLNSLPGQNILVNLDMASSPSTNGDLGAGWNGTGSLTIQDGITVTSNSGYLGYHSGSTGLATVNGTGSKWTNSNHLNVGYSGSGTLIIKNGGTVNGGGHIGYNSGSTGKVTVDGSGSTWTSSYNLYVGYSGSGTLNISNGGSVNNNYSSYLGYSSGSTGTVTVDGANSMLTNSTIYVGNSGSGTLNISNGGSVNNNYSSYLGYSSGSTGTVTVDGANSMLTSSTIQVGSYGSGTLYITNGGSVNNSTCYIGSGSGSIGTLILDGSGSNMTNSSSLYVGYSGTGSIIQTSGTNSVAGSFYLGFFSSGKGIYNLNGGTLVLQSLKQGNGAAEFNFGGGIIQASGDFSSSLPMTLTSTGGNANVDSNGYNVTLSGVLSGGGGLNKLGAGTLSLGTSNTYEGTTTIGAGTLKLSALGTIASSAVIDVQSGAVLDVSAAMNGLILDGTQTLKGSGSVLGRVVAAAGSLIEPGDSAGMLTIDGDLTLNEGARLDFELDAPAASDKISMASSTLFLHNQEFSDFTFHPLGDFGGGTYTLIDAGAIQGMLGSNLSGTVGSLPASLVTSGGDLVLVVVPEPGVWLLLAAAVAGLFAFRRWGHRMLEGRK
jgi:fibronectin-binding autotransporter adhesin